MKKMISLVVCILVLFSFATPAFSMGTTENQVTGMNLEQVENQQIDLSALDFDIEQLDINQVTTEAKRIDGIEGLLSLGSDVNDVQFDGFKGIDDAVNFGSSQASPMNRSGASVQAMAGTYYIDPNVTYSHSLGYAGDYYFFICQMTQTVDATAFLISNSMEYSLGVCVYDAQFNPLYEKYSTVPQSWYTGQRMRISASAGQYVVLLIQGNGSFVSGNAFNFGVMTTPRNSRDPYENNDDPQDVFYTGDLTTNIATYYNATLDNVYDVDWYAFSFDGQPGFQPFIEFRSISGSIEPVVLFFNVVNGKLEYQGSFEGNAEGGVRLPTSSRLVYMAVLSPTGGTGAYHLAQTKVRTASNIIKCSFSNTAGSEGMMNLMSYYGSRKTARSWITGTVIIADSYGNPIPNIELIVVFNGYGMWDLSAHTIITDNQGKASFMLPLANQLVAPYSSTIGNYTYHYTQATLTLRNLGNTVVYASEDWYYVSCEHYSGI